MNREIVSSIIKKCSSITEDLDSIKNDGESLYAISFAIESLSDVVLHLDEEQHIESLTEEEKAHARMVTFIEMLKTLDK